MLLNLTVLPGDGVGPEVTDEGVRVLEAIAEINHHQLSVSRKAVGGAGTSIQQRPAAGGHFRGVPELRAQCCWGRWEGRGSMAIPAIFGRRAGYCGCARSWASSPICARQFAFPGLENCSPLRAEVVRGTDVMIVRELLGGIYFGEPRATKGEAGKRSAVDTMSYGEAEIERIAHVAFGLAQSRRRKVTSVDKANVLDCSRLWRDVVTRVGQQYSDVKLSHMYVDSAAMALVARPSEFDVVLTENMFGDILSDQAGAVVGSLGMLGSASIGGAVGLYEPVHGSAPDIAGQGIANPLGTILSVAMLLRYSFKLEDEATSIESAVQSVLSSGSRTRDLTKPGQSFLTTSAMGQKVVEALRERSKSAGQKAAS